MLIGLVDQRLERFGRIAEPAAAIEQFHRRVPLPAPQKLFYFGIGVNQIPQRRHLRRRQLAQLEELLGKLANFMVRRIQQLAAQRGAAGIDQIVLAKQQLVVAGLVDVAQPQLGVGGQRPKRYVNHHARVMIQIQRQRGGLIAVGMLVGLDADLEVSPPDQRGHAHPVVIDQLDLARFSDHHIGVLQIAVGDLGVGQLAKRDHPALGHGGERLAIAGQTTGATPVEKRVALDPVHEDQRIPTAVTRRANGAIAVLESDETTDLAVFQIGADVVVAFVAFGRFGSEHSQGKGVLDGVDALIDYGKCPRPGARLIHAVLLDAASLQLWIAKRDLGGLQHGAKVRS